MKHSQSFTKSVIDSLLLSLLVVLVAWLCWRAGLFAPLEAALAPAASKGGLPVMHPQEWLAALLISAAGVGAGLAVERGGARRALPFVCGALAVFWGLSLLLIYFVGVSVAFVPAACAALGAAGIVQIKRLWRVDATLTRSVARAASEVNALEGGAAGERLMSGLRLLKTVLPLEEAVIFRPDEDGELTPAARLREQATGQLEVNRNSAWRAGVRLCERAVAAGELVSTSTAGAADDPHTTASPDARPTANVALPLKHEGRTLGVLFVRLREDFDKNDRPLLTAVGAQIARNFQRDEARKHPAGKNFLTFFSTRAAARRLQYFNTVSGLLTEQRFGAQALSETSDGHAIAYLDGTLAYVNAPLLRAANLTPEEAHDRDLFGLLDCFRGGVFDEPSIAVRRVLQTGDPYERELHFPDRAQTLELRIALCTERGAEEAVSLADENKSAAQPLCLAVTVRDVTRLKEYDKLKSDMISLMSHELRTPITSINGFAELLALDENIPADAREFLVIIRNESQRLSRMINTFLAVTQLEAADKQEVLKIPLKLDDVVRETLANLQPTAKRKRIRLVEQATVRLPPVAADRSMITQAVKNLVGNAIKYSPERTTVTVSTELEADAVRVLVEDRGYGIPPEAVDRVWEKFYRVARDGQEKDEESTGLGLAFVREVVEQHGGAVSLESEVGRGSKFSFTLPRL